MSVSTRAIQQPMGKGSIIGSVVMAAAVLFAVVAVTWGVANLAARKTATAPVASPVYLYRGDLDRTSTVAGTSAGGAYVSAAIAEGLRQGNRNGSLAVSNAGHGYVSAAAAAAQLSATGGIVPTKGDQLKDDQAIVPSSGRHPGLRAQ